ncbi:hypothetical protein ACFWAT_01730 [Streptomyces syringium]|uniref:hypothetical protein n=1 Tax=Streptomyces syringium TaxID=76729 RepID=UPI00365C8382
MEGKSIFSLSAGTVPHQALGPAQNLGNRRARVPEVPHPRPVPQEQHQAGRALRRTGDRLDQQRQAGEGTLRRRRHQPGNRSRRRHRGPGVSEIAHLLDAHKNIPSDEPRLKTFIGSRMIEGVKYQEDWGLLHCVGDGQSLTGIFNTPGVQQYTGLNTDQFSVQIRRAITRALLAECGNDPSRIHHSRIEVPTCW